MTLYKGPFGSVFGGTEPGLIFEPYILNGLMQARQQTLRAMVKLVTPVSYPNESQDDLLLRAHPPELKKDFDWQKCLVEREENKEDVNVQVIADVIDLMVNAKLQARPKPPTTVVKLAIAVSCPDVKDNLSKLMKSGNIDAGDISDIKADAWSLFVVGVLTRRAHLLELIPNIKFSDLQYP